MYDRRSATAETVDVADIVRTIRGHWRAVAVFTAAGIVVALLVVLLAPRRFEGRASILAKGGNAAGTSIVGRITGIGDLLGGFGGLGGATALETELQILRSRAIAGAVVDSLLLQVRPVEPSRLPASHFVERLELPGSFDARKVEFTRDDNSYVATLGDSAYRFTPGQPAPFETGTLTLRPGLPSRFTLLVMDREDAITRFARRLEANKAGGDVARIVYRGDDSISAAAGANAVVANYLERRKTIDRGTNQRRVEYVTAQVDSTTRVLAETERNLRRYQESTGVIDPEISGRIEAEGIAAQRHRLTELQVDEATVRQLLAQAREGRITSRDLAGYPGFLRATNVGPLVGQLGELEARRIRLLEERTERDPEVQAVEKTQRAVEANILATAQSFASSVSQQRAELQARVDRMQRNLLEIPAATERAGRLMRDVERLTAILTALQAQLVEARLAAIGEGGELRQIDTAVPSRKPSFPKPLLTMGIGTAGGLLSGLVAALFLGWFGRWLRDPIEIERAMGVSAQRIEPHVPLLLSTAATARTVLVVPLDRAADARVVVEQLARTAQHRALQPAVLDLSDSLNGNGAHGPLDVGMMIERLERENPMVIVRLPGLWSEACVAALRENRPVLLVAAPGPVDRQRLGDAVEMLRRLQIPCAGVMMSDPVTRRLS